MGVDKDEACGFSMRLRDAICGVLVGLPIGGLFVSAVMGAFEHPDEKPRRLLFGDIAVWATIPREDAGDEVAEDLLLTRNGRPFFYASRNAEGETADMCIVNQRKEIIFTMDPSNQSGGWMDACYGLSENGIRTGEHYTDIDLDGNFDIKFVYDRSGNRRACYIYLQGRWQQVDRVAEQKVFSGTEVFSFDSEAGWVPEKASTE